MAPPATKRLLLKALLLEPMQLLQVLPLLPFPCPVPPSPSPILRPLPVSLSLCWLTGNTGGYEEEAAALALLPFTPASHCLSSAHWLWP